MKIDESWYIKPEIGDFPIRNGAGGVIMRREGKSLLVGLVRVDGFSNYILPKGGKERGETDIETARREIEEETGLTRLEFLYDLGLKERLTFEKNYWSVMHYFLFLTDQKSGTPTDPVERYEIEWFDIDKLPEFFWPEQKDLITRNRKKIMSLLKLNV
jgi:8-oxo-dGTP pyrophosphatase MutT (NUDIX family)